MAKIKPQKAHAKLIAQGFRGIGPDGAEDIRNFRILPNGALKKREGWRVQADLGAPVRGYIQTARNGNPLTFAAAGNQVYRLGAYETTSNTTLATSEGRVRFFVYGGEIYLTDGKALRRYDDSTDMFLAVHGYVPLYGKNWHPTDMGDINEPVNLLSSCIRVHYFNTTSSLTFRLPFYADHIDRVWGDGQFLTDYTLSDDRRTLRLNTSAPPVYLEVGFTFSMANSFADRILSSAGVYTDQMEEREVLALYGGTQKNLLFLSSPVTEAVLNGAKMLYPQADSLYFRQSTVLTIGDTDHPITALYRNHDRLLVFHTGGAASVSLNPSGHAVASYPLLRSMGCTAFGLELYHNGDPVIINRGGIFCLHSSSAARDVFEVTCLSQELEQLCDDSFAANAIAAPNDACGELWFCDPSASSPLVWVYHKTLRAWYCFDHIAPAFFWEEDGRLCFGRDTALCRFEPELTTDGGEKFVASYRTVPFFTGFPEQAKRTLRFSICAKGTLTATAVTLKSDKRSQTFTFPSAPANTPFLLEKRHLTGRSRFLQVTVHHVGDGTAFFDRLAIYQNT